MDVPRSAYDEEGGLVYFPRMLDKIRLHQEGRLPSSYWDNLGDAMDGRCCDFLGVRYREVEELCRKGLDDEEILRWCYEHGRRPRPGDVEL